MKRINRILTCIDFSPYAELTLEYACELARGGQSEIIALNVINQRDINGVDMVGRYYPNNINVHFYIQHMKEEREEKMAGLIQDTLGDNSPPIRVRIDVGIPAGCILKAIESEKADLVVMANKGRGNIGNFLFGSAAEKVFRHASVPVVSVRDKDRFKRHF